MYSEDTANNAAEHNTYLFNSLFVFFLSESHKAIEDARLECLHGVNGCIWYVDFCIRCCRLVTFKQPRTSENFQINREYVYLYKQKVRCIEDAVLQGLLSLKRPSPRLLSSHVPYTLHYRSSKMLMVLLFGDDHGHETINNISHLHIARSETSFKLVCLYPPSSVFSSHRI